VGRGMQVRVSKGADYSYIPRQRFAALPCESVRPLAVDSDKADRLLGNGNACCGYSTGNDVIDGLMSGYFTRGLLTHRAVNPLCIDERPTSRVCAVAQYAVLENNAKVNGRGPFSHPHPSETPQPISMSCQYITTSPRELMCKIWLESIRPSRICACVKKTFCVDFFINISIYLSIRLSVSSLRLQVTVLGRFLRLMAQTDVISQPLVPFGGHINIVPY